MPNRTRSFVGRSFSCAAAAELKLRATYCAAAAELQRRATYSIDRNGSPNMIHVLGLIDAGGTKTVCLLADEHGAVIAAGAARRRESPGGRRARKSRRSCTK